MDFLIADYLDPGKTGRCDLKNQEDIHIFVQVHPWMEGLVIVQAQIENIPDYPVDAEGKK